MRPKADAKRINLARWPDLARDVLTGHLGLNPVPYKPPHGVTVAPPVERDAAPGYILTRTLEVNGRPVAFAFAGAAPEADGTTVTLTVPWLRQSLNYQLLRAGHAYPLFYETLFADLRREMARATRLARYWKRGLWPRDASLTGIAATGVADLEANGVLFPKLFRRLAEFWAQNPGAALDALPAWLERTREQVLDLITLNFTHFDNVVVVKDSVVRLAQPPETLVFISAK